MKYILRKILQHYLIRYFLQHLFFDRRYSTYNSQYKKCISKSYCNYVMFSHCVPRRLKRSLAFFIQDKTLFTENK
jgi:hypothetical protein